MQLSRIRLLFVISGLYDFVIGIAFLLWGPNIYDTAGIERPNHWGYIQFASLLLIIFGSMFLTVAVSPKANRNLIPFGMMLKVSFTGIVTYYWITTGVPMLFKPFAVIDGVMLVLFIAAYLALSRK